MDTEPMSEVQDMDVCENSILNFEEQVHELKNAKTKSRTRRSGEKNHNQPKPAKKVLLAVTKPSTTLAVKAERFRSKNRSILRSLLMKLVDRRNWVEASGVLSVLLKGTCKERSPPKNRIKYWVTMEVLKHIEGGSKDYSKNVFDLWMKRIGPMKKWPTKEKFMAQLEFILFFLQQGDMKKAYREATCLQQEREFGSEPFSNMVVGLTYCQLWYSTIPKELQLRDLGEYHVPMQSEASQSRCDSPLEDSGRPDDSDSQKADSSFRGDVVIQAQSDTSVRNDKDIAANVRHKKVPVKVDDNLGAETTYQNYQSQGFYMNSSDRSGEESPSNRGDDMQYDSLFNCHGLDSWLLPLRVPHANENLEDFMSSHREKRNEYFKGAIKYLRSALYSTPPVHEALVPLVQMLLLGNHIDEAVNEVDKFEHHSLALLPLRVKACLLERFDSLNYSKILACYEDILKKDPTCGHSVAKLTSMHQNGLYNTEQLLEVIALHLDATYAESNTWKDFATCFLAITRCEEEQRLICPDGEEGLCKEHESISFTEIPSTLTEGIPGKSWRLRCRWWLNRHFSKKILLTELEAGDLQLLAYKAACASHMYGPGFEYVVKASKYLEDKDREMYLFLRLHMKNSVGFYFNAARNSLK